jgi:hypothetical protein
VRAALARHEAGREGAAVCRTRYGTHGAVTPQHDSLGMPVHHASRFELDPSTTTRSALGSHAGASRLAYNCESRLTDETRGYGEHAVGRGKTNPWHRPVGPSSSSPPCNSGEDERQSCSPKVSPRPM